MIQHDLPAAVVSVGKRAVPTQLVILNGLLTLIKAMSLELPRYPGCPIILAVFRRCVLLELEILQAPATTCILPPKQCAAVTTHSGVIKVPPQKCLPLLCKLTWCFHLQLGASSPLTMLMLTFCCLCILRPSTAPSRARMKSGHALFITIVDRTGLGNLNT